MNKEWKQTSWGYKHESGWYAIKRSDNRYFNCIHVVSYLTVYDENGHYQGCVDSANDLP